MKHLFVQEFEEYWDKVHRKWYPTRARSRSPPTSQERGSFKRHKGTSKQPKHGQPSKEAQRQVSRIANARHALRNNPSLPVAKNTRDQHELNQLHKELFIDTDLVITEARNIAQILLENPNTRSTYPQLRTIDPKVLTHSGQSAEKVQFEQDVDILVDHLNQQKQLRYNTLSTTTAATKECRDRDVPTIRVLNKIDLSNRAAGEQSSDEVTTIAVSAITGAGISALEAAILAKVGVSHPDSSTPFSARERHVSILQATREALNAAIETFSQTGAGEILAEDLRASHETLGAVTGVVGVNDLLGEIFSSFCIGK